MKVKPTPFSLIKFLRREDGQLTIFLAIGLTIFLTMMAFIINVGLFVKAKINLQNATDAAAWSGAAVQARQLSQIAYLNYEIRNVYKEWMFKYYVLGNLGHSLRMGTSGYNKGDFRLKPAGGINAGSNYDRFNLPSICVHAGAGQNDVCLSSFIPGLPRFETIDLPNITDESKKFIDAISSKKADDCAYRSSINFSTALIWTYGTGASLITNDLPALANGRLGAWPAALILGARVRTLEAMVNRDAVPGICLQGGSNCIGVSDVTNDQVANERPMKAFYALLRNYSGGKFKEDNGGMDETLATLRLEELAPNEVPVDPKSLSGMLMPAQNPTWNSNIFAKRYLDLQAIPVNYAIFYTTMSAKSEPLTISGTTDVYDSDASCITTKTAIPVPAYLTGFQKNPQVLTYYAVRSSVKFSGLFFPFNTDGLEISAVAAAKPFGGRIGPKLFQVEGENSIIPRTSTVAKSAAYISGINAGSISAANLLQPGTPIPTAADFWVTGPADVIGGVPGTGITPRFSVPNMIYNVGSRQNADSEVAVHFGTGDTYERLDKYTSAGGNHVEKLGLYDPAQYDFLLRNLTNSKITSGSSYETQDLENAIKHIRQPTRYDALNYLIPTTSDFGGLNIKSNNNINEDPAILGLYAPLIDTTGQGNSLYQDPDAVRILVNGYIDENRASIEKFLSGLRDVARAIKASASPGGATDLYDKAANLIYPLTPSEADPTNAATFRSQMVSAFCGGGGGTGVVSVAARFSSFLQQPNHMCPEAKSLAASISDYIQTSLDSSPNGTFGLYHIDDWFTDTPTQIDGVEEIMTAYRPGPKNGADDSGRISNPISGGEVLNNRNYYSTKLIQFDIISNNSRSKLLNGNATSLMEENSGSTFDIKADVNDQIAGDYKNKLTEPIDVLW